MVRVAIWGQPKSGICVMHVRRWARRQIAGVKGCYQQESARRFDFTGNETSSMP